MQNQLKRGVFTSVEELEKAIRQFSDQYNLLQNLLPGQ